MKILDIKAINFGSYSKFDQDLSGQGLTLIHGPTGSGKSTVMDMACWCLFGITAKDGKADEVISWHSPLETTQVTANIVTRAGETLTVVRRRGFGSKNDLYWFQDSGEEKRGKDIGETQKLLEEKLGVSSELYLLSAYFSEFSNSASFFLAKSSAKRELFESIANLTLPIKLAEGTSNERKIVRKSLEQTKTSHSRLTGKYEQISAEHARVIKGRDNWDADRSLFEKELHRRIDTFVGNKNTKLSRISADIEALKKTIEKHRDPEACPTCGNVKDKHIRETNSLNIMKLERLETDLLRINEEQNPYTEQLEREQGKANPFNIQIEELTKEQEDYKTKIDSMQSEMDNLQHKCTLLDRLYDLSFDLRGILLGQAIQEAQKLTNEALEKYFDAEIRVEFEILKADSLDVRIYKNGHSCVYKQLSKGQRQLLKICFSVCIMKIASNRAGTHFDNLFFDEATDGCDDNLKVKSFRMFQELANNHDSVFLIDHSEELKSMFDRRYKVTMREDTSTVTIDE